MNIKYKCKNLYLYFRKKEIINEYDWNIKCKKCIFWKLYLIDIMVLILNISGLFYVIKKECEFGVFGIIFGIIAVAVAVGFHNWGLDTFP